MPDQPQIPDIEMLERPDFVTQLLEGMRANWLDHAPYNPRSNDIQFSYDEEAALEVLLNGVLDYAWAHGYRVLDRQTEIKNLICRKTSKN